MDMIEAVSSWRRSFCLLLANQQLQLWLIYQNFLPPTQRISGAQPISGHQLLGYGSYQESFTQFAQFGWTASSGILPISGLFHWTRR